MTYRTIDALDAKGKRVLLRADLNVPMKDGRITDRTRIERLCPTIAELANAGARLILAPDWKPIRWSEAERRKGQAWGLKTIESFHTHGTPTLEEMDTEGIVY